METQQITGTISDGKFRIVDQRQFIGKKHGKLCSSYTVAELKDIADYLGVKVSGSKAQICEQLQKHLISDNLSNEENKLESVPRELILEMCKGLPDQDLVNFTTAYKRARQICEPIIEQRRTKLEERKQLINKFINLDIDTFIDELTTAESMKDIETIKLLYMAAQEREDLEDDFWHEAFEGEEWLARLVVDVVDDIDVCDIVGVENEDLFEDILNSGKVDMEDYQLCLEVIKEEESEGKNSRRYKALLQRAKDQGLE